MFNIPRWFFAFVFVLAALSPASCWATVQVFDEPGFPAVDTVPFSSSTLHAALPDASFIGVNGLAQAIASKNTTLLVLPYGSAFPESAWPALKSYLDHGGNLLVLGGRPLTRAAYMEGGKWLLRDYSVKYITTLRINQYQETPGSAQLTFQANPDVSTHLSAFEWKQGFSPILHNADSRIAERGGSSGRVDSRVDAFAWGLEDGHKLAAPAVRIDHIHDLFLAGC